MLVATWLLFQTSLDPAKFRSGALFRLIDALDAIAQCFFDHADIADELGETTWLKRCAVVCSPHRTVQGDVTLESVCAQSNNSKRYLQARFVAGVPDRNAKALTQRMNHAQVRFFRVKRIGGGGVHEH